MKGRLVLIAFVILAFVLTGCDIDDFRLKTYVFSGYVVDHVTNEPIPHAVFGFDSDQPDEGQVVTTDETGYFEFVASVPGIEYNYVFGLQSLTADGYGTLYDWELYTGIENIIPLNEPNTIYGRSVLRGERIFQVTIDTETYQATTTLDENGEFTFYQVPVGEWEVYAFNGEEKATEPVTVSVVSDQAAHVLLYREHMQFPVDEN